MTQHINIMGQYSRYFRKFIHILYNGLIRLIGLYLADVGTNDEFVSTC